MKSDMLLDPETRDGDNYKRHVPDPNDLNPDRAAKGNKAHSSAAWIMNNHEHVENMMNPNNFFKASDVNKPAATASKTLSKPATILRKRSSMNSPPQPVPGQQLQPLESPLAPLSTTINASRGDLASPAREVAGPQAQAQNLETAEADHSTHYTTSPEQTNDASTTPSSAAFTPSQDSHRVSDNVYSKSTSASDGEWMKAEVEKHRQAQEGARADVDQRQKPTFFEDIERPASQNRISMNAGSVSPRNLRNISRDSKTKSQSFGGDVPILVNGHQRDSPRIPADPPYPVQSQRGPSSHSSRRNSRPGSSRRLSQEGLKETPRSPLPISDGDDIPPVPQLDARRKSELGSENKSSKVTTPFANEQDRLEGPQAARVIEQKLSGIRDKTDEPLSNSRARQASSRTASMAGSSYGKWEADAESGVGMQSVDQAPSAIRHNPSHHAPPQQQHRHQPTAYTASAPSEAVATSKEARKDDSQAAYDPPKHQHDTSILVKDFVKSSPSSSQHTNKPNWLIGPTASGVRDPKPADFDSLMSIMNSASSEGGEAPQAPQSPEPPTSSYISAPQSPQQTHPAHPSDTHSQQGNQTPRALDSQTAPGSPGPRHDPAPNVSDGLSQHPVKSISSTSLQSGTAPAPNVPVPRDNLLKDFPPALPMSPSRHGRVPSNRTGTSDSQKTTKSRKEKRGLPKLLWKLGGGDMPERKKIYVPPSARQPQVQTYVNDRDEGDESDYDEEACAAPVVGFGRGW